jgi:hypothetical protein
VCDFQLLRSVEIIRQGIRHFQCCLYFPKCSLNVPQHIQFGLVDGFVKPAAMGAIETLNVIHVRGLATAQKALSSRDAVRLIDQIVGRGGHFLIRWHVSCQTQIDESKGIKKFLIKQHASNAPNHSPNESFSGHFGVTGVTSIRAAWR